MYGCSQISRDTLLVFYTPVNVYHIDISPKGNIKKSQKTYNYVLQGNDFNEQEYVDLDDKFFVVDTGAFTRSQCVGPRSEDGSVCDLYISHQNISNSIGLFRSW